MKIKLILSVMCVIATGYVFASEPRIVAAADIGRKGTKFVIVRLSDTATGQATETLYARTADPTPLAGADAKQTLTEAGIDRTASAVSEFVTTARSTYKLPDADIKLLASSGVALAPNKSDLAKAIKAKTNLDTTFVTPTEEAIWLFRGVVPTADRDQTLVIDIGSGTSRAVGSGLDEFGRQWFVTGLLPVGTVSLTNSITAAMKDSQSDFPTELSARRAALSKTIRQAAEGNPTLVYLRRRCMLCGGTVWAAATLLYPEKVQQSFVALTPNDFERYAQLLASSNGEFPAVDLSHITDVNLRRAAEKEIARVRDTFTVQNLRAGAAILREISTAYQLQDKQLSFVRDAVFGWVLGHLKSD